MQVRRIPIRAKVAGVLALPLGVLVVGAVVAVAQITERTRQITGQATLATDAIGHASLISALESERNIGALEMVGLEDAVQLHVQSTDEARDGTDEARKGFASLAARTGNERALDALGKLPGLRAAVDDARGEPSLDNAEAALEVFEGYSDVITEVFDAHRRLGPTIDARELRRGDDLLHHTARATDAVAHLTALLVHAAVSGDDLDPDAAMAIAAAHRDLQRSNEVLRTLGSGRYEDPTRRMLQDERLIGFLVLVDEALTEQRPAPPEALLGTVPLGPGTAYDAYRDDVVRVLDEEAARLVADSRSRRRLYVGGATVVIGGTAAVAWLVSRSITGPLGQLRRQARLVAKEHLPGAVAAVRDAPLGQDLPTPAPTAVAVTSRDEVADVAEALTEVQTAAIDLAVEQAVLRRRVADSFLSLGRRNQNLVRRLLATLGELADGEEDPQALERLHRLDHLAARMRRNAESLLVVAGADPDPRYLQPVPTTDIVRTALAEIEHSEHVRRRRIEPNAVVGGAAVDVTHILAELLENAIRHSPPSEPVEVGGTMTRDGYVFAIIDHGLGMGADEIARANEQLASAPAFVAGPDRKLGHHVTAALAARHGITVRLAGSGAIGLTAGVLLPPTVLVQAPPVRPGDRALDPATTPAAGDGPVEDRPSDRLDPLFAGTLRLTGEVAVDAFDVTRSADAREWK